MYTGRLQKTTLNPFRHRSSIPNSVHSICGEVYRRNMSVAGCTCNAGATMINKGAPGASSRPAKYPNLWNSPRA
jgi:hypothetical protein